MPETLSLFETDEVTFKHRLSERLRELAAQQVFLGGSSWKYEGWLGSIYTPERYFARGRFSRRHFEQECLAEYADVFPIVCGDFAFYQFPTADFWRRLFTSVAPSFQFAFKVPEDITLPVFPNHRRYGARAGLRNKGFLSSELFESQFADLLRPHAGRTAVLILEFAASVGRVFPDPKGFAQALTKFLGTLKGSFRYGVELRDPSLFSPAYLDALRDHRVAHVFNSWTGMPSIRQQMDNEGAFTTNFTAVRALVTPGRTYDDSRHLFSPYTEVRELNVKVRQELRDLILRAKRCHEPVFIFLNNRLEGFAPGTIAAIAEDV